MTTQPSEGRGAIPEWTFGDRLRKVRRVHALTQEKFAQAIGVGMKAYGAWEAGVNSPGGSDMIAVAKRIELAFGVPATWMLGLDENPFRPDGGPRGGQIKELPRLDSNQQPSGYRERVVEMFPEIISGEAAAA